MKNIGNLCTYVCMATDVRGYHVGNVSASASALLFDISRVKKRRVIPESKTVLGGSIGTLNFLCNICRPVGEISRP